MTIHADLDIMVFQESSQRTAGELAAVIHVKDVRFAYPLIASWIASSQKSVVRVFDRRHKKTRRLTQSITANTDTKPRFLWMEGISAAQT